MSTESFPTNIIELERLLRWVCTSIKRKGREILADFEITPPQFDALVQLIKNGDLTISELSNRMYLACSTITAKPAAGPLTPSCEPLIRVTTIPPTIPAIIPEKRGAPDAMAIPKQSGTATRKTTIPAGKSFLISFKLIIIFSDSISKLNNSITIMFQSNS